MPTHVPSLAVHTHTLPPEQLIFLQDALLNAGNDNAENTVQLLDTLNAQKLRVRSPFDLIPAVRALARQSSQHFGGGEFGVELPDGEAEKLEIERRNEHALVLRWLRTSYQSLMPNVADEDLPGPRITARMAKVAGSMHVLLRRLDQLQVGKVVYQLARCTFHFRPLSKKNCHIL